MVGPHGPVPIRLYHPESSPTGPGAVLLWVHGGGFAGGDLDMPESDWVARRMAGSAGVTVVTVGYRLAGDDIRYPIPSDDALAVWQWMFETHPLSSTRRRYLGGASAGGNLATGVALRCDPHLRPAGLLLAYPTLHAVQAGYEGGAWGWSPAEILAMYRTYVGGDPLTAPSTAVPGAASLAELSTLPATRIVLSERDGLRPSGEQFAGQLRDAGVAVALRLEAGTSHGHLNDPDDPGAEPSIRFLIEPLAG